MIRSIFLIIAINLPCWAGSSLSGPTVSLWNSFGRSNVFQSASLVTTATTANQVVLSYTVTTGKILYLQYVSLQAGLTATSNSAAILGIMSVESNAGNKVITVAFTHPTTSQINPPAIYIMSEPIIIPSGTVIRFVATPSVATSTWWIANFGGYERSN